MYDQKSKVSKESAIPPALSLEIGDEEFLENRVCDEGKCEEEKGKKRERGRIRQWPTADVEPRIWKGPETHPHGAIALAGVAVRGPLVLMEGDIPSAAMQYAL